MVRRSYGRHLWLIALALLAFALPAIAQEGTIQGTVKDAKGMPIEGAKVVVELVGSGRPREMKSGKNGDWIQIGLVSGQYMLTVEKEGVGKTQRTVAVRARVRNAYDVVLAPGADASADPSAA